MNNIIESIKNGLIVSCQARPGNPLRGPEHMAAMALAAEMGGAVAIRADGPKDIAAIKKLIHIPVIGIYKTEPSPDIPYITPDFEHAKAIADLGVEIIAIDATLRHRPNGVDVAELIKQIKKELNVLVMADIATFEEGVAAAEAGADIVATTLSGYTTYSPFKEEPDLELVKRLKKAINVPIIAEGRYNSPKTLREGIDAGAHAVVIGKSITNITFSTERFIKEAGL
jgi:putative N-acetylmannosamine-6-phosphate epimerase